MATTKGKAKAGVRLIDPEIEAINADLRELEPVLARVAAWRDRNRRAGFRDEYMDHVTVLATNGTDSVHALHCFAGPHPDRAAFLVEAKE